MSVNLIKLCVGVDSAEHLAKLQRERRAAQKKAGGVPQSFHRTTMMPKRRFCPVICRAKAVHGQQIRFAGGCLSVP